MGDLGETLYQLVFQKNKLVRGAAVTLLVYLFFRFLFPLTAPFLLAFFLMTLCYPILQKIQKKIPMRKKFLAAWGLFLLLFLAAVFLWLLGYNSSGQLERLTGFLMAAGNQIKNFLHQCCYRLDGTLGFKGYEIERFLVERMTIVMENVQVQIVPKMLASSYSCVKGIVQGAGFLLIVIIAAVLLEKDYAAFLNWIQTTKELDFLWKTIQGVLTYVTTFLRAQGIILFLISVLCASVLWAAGITNGVILGILAGILDMLPFIGTGIVLVPIAIWQLINGNYMVMIICLLLYVSCICIREFLEPKLIGNRLGIAPVLMLFGIYAGVRLFGIGGIIKGPLALIVIYELMKTEETHLGKRMDI